MEKVFDIIRQSFNPVDNFLALKVTVTIELQSIYTHFIRTLCTEIVYFYMLVMNA